jgi:hypothetical protein
MLKSKYFRVCLEVGDIKKSMTLAEIHRKGWDALVRELGYSGAYPNFILFL